MSIIGALEKRLYNLSVTDEKAWDSSLWRLRGAQTQSGENVTEYTALTYSAVWNAQSIISGTVSTLPLHLLRKDQKKTLFVTEKKLFRVLHDRFNPYMTAQVGREVITAHVLLWGNCYAEIVRNGYGEITELWPIAPNRVRIEVINGQLIYQIRVGGIEIPLTRRNILHIPGLGFDGFQGYSVVAMARKSIGLGMAMETFGERYFGAGTHPGVIISHPGELKDPSKLRDALSATYSGLGQTHRLMLLEEGMKLEKLGVPPNDSQFLESRIFQISEIARWFNLNLHKLKEMDRATNNNIESEQISYVTDCILPILIRFEQNYNMQLLTESEQFQQNIYTRHNVDGLLRGNTKDRALYYRTMFMLGAMSINDVRDKESWDPIDQEFADEYFVPLNMAPLSMLREMLEKNKPLSVPQSTVTDQVFPKKQ